MPTSSHRCRNRVSFANHNGRQGHGGQKENAMASIKIRQNGPYLVEGDDVTVVDWNGNPYQIAKRPFALCRCGGSTNKPFCDGTHSRSGFQAAEAAVPGSGDKPAE